MTVTVVIPTSNGAARLPGLLRSLTSDAQILVVDNGSTDGTRDILGAQFPEVDVLRLPRNEGFSRAVNRAVAVASGSTIVLVNDDCVCEPEFVQRLASAVDPTRSTVMAAGVLLEHRRPSLIDTAGMQLDKTMLVFDYLNGQPVSVLDSGVPDPIGPCAAAAAFDRDALLSAGGFDERLFAYWEDVDLVLRMALGGGRCRLVPEARATHLHSATLGSGSPAKNYLTGFGRTYVMRKWGVLTPRRLPAILARDVSVCIGQAVVDRNLAGIQGRLDGLRAARKLERMPYPDALLSAAPHVTAAATLAQRARRRVRLTANG